MLSALEHSDGRGPVHYTGPSEESPGVIVATLQAKLSEATAPFVAACCLHHPDFLADSRLPFTLLRCIFFGLLPVLIEGGGSNALQFAPAECRFDNV